MQTTGFDHIVLNVSDLERSRRFYATVLGFDLHTIPPDFPHPIFAGCHYFAVGTVEVFLVSHRTNQPGDSFSEFRIGLDHLSFKAPDEAALHALVERLREHGVPTNGVESFISGQQYVAFRDPDHIQLEYWLSRSHG